MSKNRTIGIAHKAMHDGLRVHENVKLLQVGSPNRTCASMSSSPLFIKVALSTEIFAPIDQFGWRTACSGVTAAIRSAGQVRNGPPGCG